MSYYIREDPLTGDRVIISSVRSKRPHMFKESNGTEEPLQCPFCPGNEGLTPREFMRVGENSSWLIRVIPNKFPAIPHMHDVVVDSPNHNDDIDTIDHLDKLLWVFKERSVFYYNVEGVKFVSVFRNRGKSAGASIPHPHSQILAIPFYPERYLKEKIRYEKENRNVMKEFIEKELKFQERIVFTSNNFLALASFAPVAPYELWIVPKEQIPSFVFEHRFEELAHLIKKCVSSLKLLLGEGLSYNVTFQSAPPWDKDYHYYIRIIPRISVIGGFEMETQNVIVTVSPEVASMELRSVIYSLRSEKV